MTRLPSAPWSISRCHTIIASWMAPWRTSSWAKSSTHSRTGRKRFSRSNQLFHGLGFTRQRPAGWSQVSSLLPATSYLLSSMCATPKLHNWGSPPWQIDFTATSKPAPLPEVLDFAVIGGGFTGLAAATWLLKIAPGKLVAVFQAGYGGAVARGRTRGMALAESAAGDLPGLGDVLAWFSEILDELGVECDRYLNGAWEVGRDKALAGSAISWNDSGTLRVTKEVPGGTIDPGKLVSGLAPARRPPGAPTPAK